MEKEGKKTEGEKETEKSVCTRSSRLVGTSIGGDLNIDLTT